MKPFNMKQLMECEFNIPNLHPDFRFTQETRRNWNGNNYQVFKLEVKGTRIINEADVAIDPDDWYHALTISKNTGHIVDRSLHLLKWSGLATKNQWNGDTASIDALYYLSNPPTLRLLNGKLRKGIYREVAKRLRSTKVQFSAFTKTLLDTIINDTKTRLPHFNNDEVIQHLKTCFGIIELKTCCLTNDIYPIELMRCDEFGADLKYYYHTLNPEDYGYARDRATDRHNSIWIHESEIFYRGRTYKRATLVMQHCPECGTESPAEGFDEGVCWECLQKRYKIHNYSTKVPTLLKFKAKNVKPSTIYLGIELEYETRDKDTARIKVGKALANHAIMKSDGSIRNGFEIVTCPATLEIHQEEFKRFFNNLPGELYAAPNTGMHVHVSRKPLNQFTIGKMTEFVNRLDNKQFIAFIAGRIDNSYARQEPERTVTYPFAKGSGNRYNALNLQNSDTIEFRIFSTPVNWEQFASRLEFCQALTDYCQPAQVGTSLKHLTHHSSFINWLSHNRKSYPELANHLKGFA
jgi:hypothetical protein